MQRRLTVAERRRRNRLTHWLRNMEREIARARRFSALGFFCMVDNWRAVVQATRDYLGEPEHYAPGWIVKRHTPRMTRARKLAHLYGAIDREIDRLPEIDADAAATLGDRWRAVYRETVEMEQSALFTDSITRAALGARWRQKIARALA